MEANRARRTRARDVKWLKGGEPSSPGEGEPTSPGNGLVFESGEWWIEWPESYPLQSYEGAFVEGPDEQWCQEAVERAKSCYCSNSRRFLASIETGDAFALPCLSWSCEKCNRRKWHAARELFRLGIEAAWARGEKVRFLTLTVKDANISAAELAACWDRLATILRRGGLARARPKKPKKLETPEQRASWKKRYEDWERACRRRKSYLDQYAAVIELGEETNRIHMHVLLTGRYIPPARLRRYVVKAGFGHVTQIKLVRNSASKGAETMARYAGKMASYTAKASKVAESLRARGSERVRPVRTSRDWLEGGLRKIEEDKGIRKKPRGPDDPPPKDRGPWAMIEMNKNGEPTWLRTVGDKTIFPHASDTTS